MTDRRGDPCSTYMGRKFWPLDPRADEMHITDIAHALALEGRYGNHALVPYSDAEHSLLMSYVAEPQDQREALLHDCDEAYMPDMPHGLKHSSCPVFNAAMSEYRLAGKRILAVAFEKFGVHSTRESQARIKMLDNRIVLDESEGVMRDYQFYQTRLRGLFKTGVVIEALPWHVAEHAFLQRFIELFPSVEIT